MCLERIFPKPCYFPDKRFQLRLGISECVRRTCIAWLGGMHRMMGCPIRRAKHNPARLFRNSRPVAIRDVQDPIQKEGMSGSHPVRERTVHGLRCSYEALQENLAFLHCSGDHPLEAARCRACASRSAATALELALPRDVRGAGPWRVPPAACMRCLAQRVGRSDCFPRRERDGGGQSLWKCRNVPSRIRRIPHAAAAGIDFFDGICERQGLLQIAGANEGLLMTMPVDESFRLLPLEFKIPSSRLFFLHDELFEQKRCFCQFLSISAFDKIGIFVSKRENATGLATDDRISLLNE